MPKAMVSARRLESRSDVHLRVDRIGCDGRGICAELLPEMIRLDEWGYPIVSSAGVPRELRDAAKHAAQLCPKIALHLERIDEA